MTQPNLIEVESQQHIYKAKLDRAIISFRVNGIPRPQPRARSFVLRGKGGKPIMSKSGQPIIRVHEAGTAENWKSQIALAAKEYCPFPPILGPIRLQLHFLFARPKAHFTSRGMLKQTAPGWHISRGDFDNMAKAVTDALTVLGMWKDDSQLCDVRILKSYADLVPGLQIVIEEL